MENSHRFFSNRECKYFPCHARPDQDSYNCIFCYCPLYFLGDRCGGLFDRGGEKGVKSCINCHLPHMPAFYDNIVAKLTEEGNMITLPAAKT